MIKENPVPNQEPEVPSIAAANDPEIQKIMQRIKKIDEDLNSKMDHICKLSGMPKTDVLKFLDDPKNFPEEDWHRVQQEKNDLEKKLLLTMGVQAKKEITVIKEQQMDKNRKGKTLGLRKGWIQM